MLKNVKNKVSGFPSIFGVFGNDMADTLAKIKQTTKLHS